LRGSGEAGLGAYLTHGRGELRSSRKEGTKNGVMGRLGRDLKGASDIPSAFPCFYLFISYPGILKRDEPLDQVTFASFSVIARARFAVIYS